MLVDRNDERSLKRQFHCPTRPQFSNSQGSVRRYLSDGHYLLHFLVWRWQSLGGCNSKGEGSDRHFFFSVIFILLTLLVSGCDRSKLTQCEQIFRIVSEVNHSSQNISYTEDQSSMKSWLEAASMMDKAANQIQALHVNNPQLIKHQNKLVTIYRIYSQATYDAVQARESKNLEALDLARIDAGEAGKIHQDAIKEINNYCLDR
ncbi:hypothetical protein I4641_05705 [Waterburya agarophytonicola K14]|uniref:Uncharacterized protein n=1 Tax=Waterburya agarophytonicola KI4 TaxID=2874699 RepID=A0A964FF01_9CYAN|nr:hypothetical protein [Waterburya agarophytonicola]MCC0176472.1 hypothetical protein [Waterburya agarophytonicola KI4]